MHITFAAVLLLTLIVGLVRIVLGPMPADRILAAQLFGTTGVTVILLLGHGLNEPGFYSVALIFALLATVAVVACVRRTWHPPLRDSPPVEGGRGDAR
jgi:multicomponent Na+:H+ antiporter subunit F